MNLQDHLAELVLPIFDVFMNLITLGNWGAAHGARKLYLTDPATCTCLDPLHVGDNPDCPMHGKNSQVVL